MICALCVSDVYCHCQSCLRACEKLSVNVLPGLPLAFSECLGVVEGKVEQLDCCEQGSVDSNTAYAMRHLLLNYMLHSRKYIV